MYLILGTTVLLILTITYKKCLKINRNLKFDNLNDIDKESNVILCDIQFYDNNNHMVKKIISNNVTKIDNFKKLDFSFYLFDYEYYIITYKYKTIYKWISQDNDIKNQYIMFPFYDKEKYKKYIFKNTLNKIYIDDKILNINIEAFMGPNYNFYNDLNYKITAKQICDYFNVAYNFDSILTLEDMLNNKYDFTMNDNLKWDPILSNKL